MRPGFTKFEYGYLADATLRDYAWRSVRNILGRGHCSGLSALQAAIRCGESWEEWLLSCEDCLLFSEDVADAVGKIIMSMRAVAIGEHWIVTFPCAEAATLPHPMESRTQTISA